MRTPRSTCDPRVASLTCYDAHRMIGCAAVRLCGWLCDRAIVRTAKLKPRNHEPRSVNHQTAKPVNQEPRNPVKHQTAKPVNQEPRKPVKHQTAKKTVGITSYACSHESMIYEIAFPQVRSVGCWVARLMVWDGVEASWWKLFRWRGDGGPGRRSLRASGSSPAGAGGGGAASGGPGVRMGGRGETSGEPWRLWGRVPPWCPPARGMSRPTAGRWGAGGRGFSGMGSASVIICGQPAFGLPGGRASAGMLVVSGAGAARCCFSLGAASFVALDPRVGRAADVMLVCETSRLAAGSQCHGSAPRGW